MEIREDLGPLRRRSALLFLAVLLALGALHLRLVQLQLVNGSHWRRMAENNRLRRMPLPSSRGRIYDRRGNLLADTRATWELLLFPQEARDLGRTALFLARIGIADAATLEQRLRDPGQVPLAPVLAGEELSWSQVAHIRAHQSEFPELHVVSRFRRHYPHGDVAAHAIGHLRPVQQSELDADATLNANSLVGATGVEEQKNAFLSGIDGERWVIVSAVGQQLGVVRERAASSGNDLGLTLDLELQTLAQEALGDHAGAVVAMDVRSGALRILYSAPSFNPNAFVGRLSRSEWETLRDDPRHPLQDRCLQGAYPPGSTIKPFLAIGALTEGLVTPRWRVTCQGSLVLHGHRFRCWRRSGHGSVRLRRSLEVSCDSYYYLLGQKLGIEGIERWMSRFGFGQRSGLGFPSERPGLLGNPQWSLRVRKQPWYPGETVSVSIGQGPILATSLQLARAFAALANGGLLLSPHLVEDANLSGPRHIALDPAHLEEVVAGLELVVHGREGTARRLASLPVAGKTGTAQVARLQEGVDVEDLEPHLRHHAWFVGWAPLDEPQLVVCVLVEHGMSGGGVAAPIAGTILRAALEPARTHPGPDQPAPPPRLE
jgi:penicillin-binding protein 2